MAQEKNTYRAFVGEETYDVKVEGDRLSLDGEAVAYVFEPSGGSGYLLVMDGRSYSVVVERQLDGSLLVTLEGQEIEVRVKDEKALLLERFGLEKAEALSELEVRAPMPGLVLQVHVEPGQAVDAGAPLLVLEAMKMENELCAPADGLVEAISVKAGDAVEKNELLITFGKDPG